MPTPTLNFARAATLFVASKSTNTVVSKAIKNLVPADNRLESIELAIGTFVISGMVATKAHAWAAQQFDDTVDAIREFRNRTTEDTPDDEDTLTDEA